MGMATGLGLILLLLWMLLSLFGWPLTLLSELLSAADVLLVELLLTMPVVADLLDTGHVVEVTEVDVVVVVVAVAETLERPL